jgi:uncharacterized integral membrane protein
MSARPETPKQSAPARDRRSRREQTRMVVALSLAILITLFAVLNVNDVKVDWIVSSARAPLIVVIVVSLLIGVALGRVSQRRSAKRR